MAGRKWGKNLSCHSLPGVAAVWPRHEPVLLRRPIAQALAFEGLLDNGEAFANRLLSAFADDSPRLVHIATDGESYGHHHAHGDMALAHALNYIESNGLAQVTNYGRFLEEHPPAFEVEIFEKQLVELRARHRTLAFRLRVQQRRPPRLEPGLASPLRAALDWLRDAVNPAYEQLARQFLTDPWAARDDYIDVIVDRSPERVSAFMTRHATRP